MIRYRRSYNSKLCRLRIGQSYMDDLSCANREIKVTRLRGEYGRKAET